MRYVRLLLALFVCVVAAACAARPALAFTDVPSDHPCAVAIEDLSQFGVVVGFDDGTFRPDVDVKRVQFAKMIVLTLRDIPVSEADVCPFPDVARSAAPDLYPDHYVAVAAANRITEGYDDGTFRPYESISRAQVVTMVVRAVGDRYPGLLMDASGSSSWGEFDSEHAPLAAVAAANGLLANLPVESLDPWEPMPRGEVARVLHNVRLKLWPDGPDPAEPDETAAQARAYVVGSGWLVGSLRPAYDTDWVRFATVPGQTYRIRFLESGGGIAEGRLLAVSTGAGGEDQVDASSYGSEIIFRATEGETFFRAEADSLSGDGTSFPYTTSYHLRVDEQVARTLSGRIVDGDGNGVAGATVSAAANAWEASVESAADGAFIFSMLPPGSYLLGAQSFYDRPFRWYPGVEFEDQQHAVRFDLTTASREGVEMALPAGATLRVTLVDAEGTSVEGGVLNVQRAGVWGPGASRDDQGRWVFEGLLPGEWRLQWVADPGITGWWYHGGTMGDDPFGEGAEVVTLGEGEDRAVIFRLPVAVNDIPGYVPGG